MYYANEFNYYTIKEGKRISYHYTGCTLYKTRVQAENNAKQEWLNMAENDEILDYTTTKLMLLWKNKEEQESNTEK